MYDIIIIGAGPAGLTASIYASCFKLSHVVIGSIPGGQMSFAPDILNYPGFVEITGTELTNRMVEQAKKRGGEIIIESVTTIEKNDEGFFVKSGDGHVYHGRTLILATGVERKKLKVPGEIEYTGKGIQYCAKCERFDYENQITAVIGGGNAAAQTAVQLAHAAEKVYLILRGDTLRCDPLWLSQIKDSSVIETLYNASTKEIVGDGQALTGIRLLVSNLKTGQQDQKELRLHKLFIEIGGVPGTALVIPLGVKTDQKGFIEVDDHLQTSLPGIFAAGDVISYSYSIEQISSAVGLGAKAATAVFSYLKQQNAPTLWGKTQMK